MTGYTGNFLPEAFKIHEKKRSQLINEYLRYIHFSYACSIKNIKDRAI